MHHPTCGIAFRFTLLIAVTLSCTSGCATARRERDARGEILASGAAISDSTEHVGVYVPRTGGGAHMFGDAELTRIAPHLPHLRGFRWLDLDGTSVTDAGIENLSRVPQLRELLVARTAVTADGIRALKSLPRLERVSVSWGQLSSSDIASLKREMPKVDVFRVGRQPATGPGL